MLINTNSKVHPHIFHSSTVKPSLSTSPPGIPSKDTGSEKLQYQLQLSQRQQRDLQNKVWAFFLFHIYSHSRVEQKVLEELQSSQEDSMSMDSSYITPQLDSTPLFEQSVSPSSSFIVNDKRVPKSNSSFSVNLHPDTNIIIRPAGFKTSSKLERSLSRAKVPQFTDKRWQVTFNGIIFYYNKLGFS